MVWLIWTDLSSSRNAHTRDAPLCRPAGLLFTEAESPDKALVRRDSRAGTHRNLIARSRAGPETRPRREVGKLHVEPLLLTLGQARHHAERPGQLARKPCSHAETRLDGPCLTPYRHVAEKE